MNPQLLMGIGYILAGALLGLGGMRGLHEIQKRRGRVEPQNSGPIMVQLVRMETEWKDWRERIDLWRDKIDQAVFHTDGHIHVRIHKLEGDIAVPFQEQLRRIALLERSQEDSLRSRSEDRSRHDELRVDMGELRKEIVRLREALADRTGGSK